MRKLTYILLCLVAVCFSSCSVLDKPLPAFTANRLLAKQELTSSKELNQIVQNPIMDCSKTSKIVDKKAFKRNAEKDRIFSINKTVKNARKLYRTPSSSAIIAGLLNSIHKPILRSNSHVASFSNTSTIFPLLALIFLIITVICIIFLFSGNISSFAFIGVDIVIGLLSAVCSLIFFILGLALH